MSATEASEEPKPTISFLDGTQQFSEDSGIVSIKLVLEYPVTESVSVEVIFSEETAMAWEDYLSVDSEVVFEPGELEKIISFEIIDDYLSEPAEFFSIRLEQFTNARPGSTPSFESVIRDNDHPKIAHKQIDVGESSTSFISSVTGNHLVGYSVSTIGDVNADGYADILLGGYQYDVQTSDEGAAFLVFGDPNLFKSHEFDLETDSIIFEGIYGEGWLGHSVSIGGDIDGDGRADLALGARFESGLDELRHSGAAYVIMGKDVPQEPGHYPLTEIPHITLLRQEPGTETGFEIALGGDVDGDGKIDLIVRSLVDTKNKIAGLYLVPGSVLSQSVGETLDLDRTSGIIQFTSTEAYSDAGRTITFISDFDGDSRDEIVLGSLDGTFYYAGNLPQPRRGFLWIIPSSIISGNSEPTISLESPSILRFSIESDQRFHISVGSAGDIDQDGLGDLLVGLTNLESREDIRGNALLILGRSLATYQGLRPLSQSFDLLIKPFEQGNNIWGDQFGYSISEHAGDVDNDGLPDLLVGARGSSFDQFDQGAAYLIPGSLIRDYLTREQRFLFIQNEPSVFMILGENSGDLFSSKRRISNAGDVNGDGFADLLIGAPGYSSDNGKVYLISGAELTR